MRLFVIAVCALLAGCSASSVQSVSFTPAPNTCEKVSAHDFWSSAVAMPCFGADAKPIGMVAGSGQAPVDVFTSATNAAVLGAAIPLAATLVAAPSASAAASAAAGQKK